MTRQMMESTAPRYDTHMRTASFTEGGCGLGLKSYRREMKGKNVVKPLSAWTNCVQSVVLKLGWQYGTIMLFTKHQSLKILQSTIRKFHEYGLEWYSWSSSVISLQCTLPCMLLPLCNYMTHQQNSKMSEVITATFHFLGSLIEYSAAAAVPCTKAICMMQAHPGMFGNTSIQPYALSLTTFSQV